ncbi:MAG TPA: hypothetical protein VK123_01400 [Candidatus Limnocylindrales bacterium]|nr:hypothetical protein [Candidatus Limnocylindrales bacterium]
MVRTNTVRAALMGLAAATLLAGSLMGPGVAEAKDHGKWWTPRQGQGDGGRWQGARGERHGQGGGVSRQWRAWGGQRVYRDQVVIRTGNRVPRYRAWRAYYRPQYVYSRRIIRVHPVRFHLSAAIGGVSIHGGYRSAGDYQYGCNFCDARFSDYDDYAAHVATCPYRPHGYRVECSDWDSPADAGWWDEGEWRDYDDGGAYYRDSGDYPDYRNYHDYHDNEGSGDYEDDYYR